MKHLVNMPVSYKTAGGGGGNAMGFRLCAQDEEISNLPKVICGDVSFNHVWVPGDTSTTYTAVSSSSSDTSQYLYVYGTSYTNQRVFEKVTLNGTTAVTLTSGLFYFENMVLDVACDGEITLNANSDVAATISSGSLSLPALHKFTGDGGTNIVSLSADFAATEATNPADTVYLELRWYPTAATAYDLNAAYSVIDRIVLYRAYKVDVVDAMAPTATKVFKPTLGFPPGGYVAVVAYTKTGEIRVNAILSGYDVVSQL